MNNSKNLQKQCTNRNRKNNDELSSILEEKSKESLINNFSPNSIKNNDENNKKQKKKDNKKKAKMSKCDQNEIRDKEKSKIVKNMNDENGENKGKSSKRGKPRKNTEKKEEKRRQFKKSACQYCGLFMYSTNIKTHIKNRHGLETEYRTEIIANKCSEAIIRIFDYIYFVNFYKKDLYKILKKKDKNEYSRKEWYINFKDRMQKLSRINLNNNNVQEAIEDPIILKESEQMKNFKPNDDFYANFK